jgi:hypothetical protein
MKPGKPAPHARIIWLGGIPAISVYLRTKKGKSSPAAKILIQTQQKEIAIQATESDGKWLIALFPLLLPGKHEPITYAQVEDSYRASRMGDFNVFWEGPVAGALIKTGLLITV